MEYNLRFFEVEGTMLKFPIPEAREPLGRKCLRSIAISEEAGQREKEKGDRPEIIDQDLKLKSL